MNCKYIIIVVILAAIVGGGILAWQYWEMKKEEVKTPEIEEGMYIRPDFFRGSFSVSDDPVLNRVVDLTFIVNPIQGAPNSTIKLLLPEGIELIGGDTEWSGDIRKDEQVQLETSLRVIKTGGWEIEAFVRSIFLSGHKEDISYYICLITTEISGETSKSCPTKPSLEQKPIQE